MTINSKIFNFLSELKANNNREWFQDNKKHYQEAHAEFKEFVNLLIPLVAEIDNQVSNITAKDCMFRIYRDVRFSKNKLPYKENFGAHIVPGGKKSGLAGYYLHVEPGGNSFLGIGSYHPQADMLKSIRTEIYYQSDNFKAIINAPPFKAHFGGLMMTEDKLKTAPKGFPKDFPDIDLLRYKNYVAGKTLSDEELLQEGLTDYICETFRAGLPFNRFLNEAVANDLET